MNFLYSSTFIVLICLSGYGFAEEITTLDKQKKRIENFLDQTGYNIDRFITHKILNVKEIALDDSARASARLTLESGYIDTGKIVTNANVNLSLVLPNTKKHVKFFFEGDQSSELDAKHPSLTDERLKDKALQTGLQYRFSHFEQWNPRFRGGIRVKENLLNPFAEARIKRRFGERDQHFDFSLSARYSRLDRMVYTLHGDVFKKLTPIWDVKFTNNLVYSKPLRRFSYQHGPIFIKKLKNNALWLNQLTISGDNKGIKTYDTLTLSTRFIRPIYKDWILGEVEPVHTHSLVGKDHTNAIYFRVHALFNR